MSQPQTLFDGVAGTNAAPANGVPGRGALDDRRSRARVAATADVDTRVEWAGDVGDHRPSMLVDLETGRPMEIDTLVTAVVAMSDLVGIDTPTVDLVLALVAQRAPIAGCHDGAA